MERPELLHRAALWRGAKRVALLSGVPLSEFHQLTRDDILSIRAYLSRPWRRSATRRPSRAALSLELPRVDARLGLSVFKPGIFEPDQNKSAAWNRGGYLVTGLSHCGACHTPKNVFGADRRGRAFAGGPVQGWFAPASTARRAAA